MNRLVIISGLSGSGKSFALNALEDLDFYAIDNLPIKLFEKFLDLVTGSDEYQKVAMVMDNRDTHFAENYQKVFDENQKKMESAEILFLEADDKTLLKRFSETRRRHPLSKDSVEEGIEREKKLLKGLKDYASTVIDTSHMSIHELKKRITKQFGTAQSSQMQVQFVSFGFKHGVPTNCDLVIDVRFFSNPYFNSELRDQTGLDPAVQDYIRGDSRFEDFMERTLDYLRFLIPQYQNEGKRYLKLGIGCTGGKHRSVFVAESLAKDLKKDGNESAPILVEHPHIQF